MIVILISLLGLALGSYTDIKTREIPDTLSLGMIFLGISISIGSSLLSWSYKPVLASIIGMSIGASIGLASYYTGQWGGGDAKVLIGLGALIGFDIFSLSAGVPEFAIFMLLLMLVGAVYGVAWLLGLALKNWKVFRPEFRTLRRKSKILRLRIVILSGTLLFTAIVFLFEPAFEILASVYLLLLFGLLFMYLFIAIKAVENTCMKKLIPIAKLTEGDWVLDKVKIKNAEKYIYTKTGITTKGIKMLFKSGRRNVLVKEGIPFLPSFFLAYAATSLITIFHLFPVA